MKGDLTNLSNYKEWAGVTHNGADPLISRLISSSSLFLVNWINKNIGLNTYVEKRNGNGATTLPVKNWPLMTVTNLTINGATIPLSPNGISPGYLFDTYNIYLVGGAYFFIKGVQNISITYSAGFYAVDTFTVPAAPFQLTSSDLSEVWTNGFSVTLNSTGLPLTKITSGTPSTGQYVLNNSGVYLFAAADVGQAITITYGSPPFDVEQACIELVASRAKEKDRIGISSKTVATESVAYSQKDMSENIRSILQQYKSVIPL